ncbi:MAG: gephyrin-like molybdotransferase Glp [Bacteroidales bacterium]
MVLFEEALHTVLTQTFSPETERVPLHEAVGRILAEDIFSDMNMPPFDKSAVDGYACLKAEKALHAENLQVLEIIPAGSVPQHAIIQGTCSKIMTGAMLPPGADCVIMVEETKLLAEKLVQVTHLNTGTNICYQGEDIRQGDLVLHKGIRITPAHVAVLASVGATDPLVARLPRVGIISTGDELVEPWIVPGIARIRNSNASQLEAQLRALPAQPNYYGIVTDEGPELRKIIDLALSNNDVVLLTGGVSMGDFDFVPAIMEESGLEILFKSIAIQPGKPTVFARKSNTFAFGLPGNPVSSFVLFEVLVKPFLLRLMGCTEEPLTFKLPMGADFSRRKSVRKSMIPVIIRDGQVFPVEYHGSAHTNAYSVATGIMAMEIGATTIKKGEQVYVRPL